LDVGAEVTLITTPTNLVTPLGCQVITVRTAAEMLVAVMAASADASALIMAAAVADFRPAVISTRKIKKNIHLRQIELEPTLDILSEVAHRRGEIGFPRCVVGFAAESDDLLSNAQAKLNAKHLDLIVANDISASDAGFEVETNRVIFLFADGRQQPLPLLPKEEVAQEIIRQVQGWL
jgi:phosphopantothenoylcysteine decarboxylase/phosphopantothenate--cysteine ligase